MDKKQRILNAWIMIEHLSEGDIKLKSKDMLKFDDLTDNDFLLLFKRETDKYIEKRRISPKDKYGYVVYFEIFDFKDVVNFLRELYNLEATDAELKNSNKFTLAVYFDKEFQFISESTFFTESAYILREKKVPEGNEFQEYEEEVKSELKRIFDNPENDYHNFNTAMKELISKFHFNLEFSRFKILENIENAKTNLHSFFIRDLTSAKSIKTNLLDLYLGQCTSARKKEDRINLDSKNDSLEFNPDVFYEILMPDNYPIGRFPSNVDYALSFMQQVAVNLSIGIDKQQIRSVNGPPGTGKTTLLKDIFAELIVRQALTIVRMTNRQIKGTEKTAYLKNASIGELIDEISENGIVVASSNNGAVKNIVDELPKIAAIDKEFISELKAADYFMNIINSKISSKWITDENGKNHEEMIAEPIEGEPNYWGMFSLEGGRAENMKHIVTVMKLIYKYLNEEYDYDPNIYEEFKKQYADVNKYRSHLQKVAESLKELENKRILVVKKRTNYNKEYEQKKGSLNKRLNELSVKLEAQMSEISILQNEMTLLEKESQTVKEYIEQLNEKKRSLDEIRTGFFDFKGKAERKKIRREFLSLIQEKLKEDISLSKKQYSIQSDIAKKKREAGDVQRQIDSIKGDFERWNDNATQDIDRLDGEIAELTKISDKVHKIDMKQDYDCLQQSNPWFDKVYRTMQSELFIAALKVRKQFLYENRSNIKAAAEIWEKQDVHMDNNRVIIAAWHWINFAIPVISSTFASFSYMCKNLPPETLGHLFIDEAGQAIPQASVGAIFRSRHVTVLGDPAQIKPVLTLDSKILKMLCKHFNISENYLSDSCSTQSLVDSVSHYGFYRDIEKTEWIGIPLWVHRRCRMPMFEISNKLSYNGLMVLGKTSEPNDKYGKAAWYDVSGTANDKYVEAQGEFLIKKLRTMIEQDHDIIDKKKKDKVYIITPFVNVAEQLAKKLDCICFTRRKKGKATNIGTIHTFQGKEAPIVFMVLGADCQSSGAASWAVDEPNMMNVAVTRAKEEFYIIGDKNLYLSLGSDTANLTAKIIENYNRKHPQYATGQEQVLFENNEVEESSQTMHYISGMVHYVGKGKTSCYAYVNGNDDNRYIITENVYSITENAEEIIKKGNEICFTVDKQGKYVVTIMTN